MVIAWWCLNAINSLFRIRYFMKNKENHMLVFHKINFCLLFSAHFQLFHSKDN